MFRYQATMFRYPRLQPLEQCLCVSRVGYGLVMHRSYEQWGVRSDGQSRQMAGPTHQVRIRSKYHPHLAARNGTQAAGGRVPFGQFRR